MVQPVRLMPAIQMNQLLVRVLLRLSTHDAPPVLYAAIVLPSHVGATFFISEVTPSAHATPSLLLPFSSYPSSFMQFTCHIAASLPEPIAACSTSGST